MSVARGEECISVELICEFELLGVVQALIVRLVHGNGIHHDLHVFGAELFVLLTGSRLAQSLNRGALLIVNLTVLGSSRL